jgi:hypothetical protein
MADQPEALHALNTSTAIEEESERSETDGDFHTFGIGGVSLNSSNG